jgi:hypothetical protein
MSETEEAIETINIQLGELDAIYWLIKDHASSRAMADIIRRREAHVKARNQLQNHLPMPERIALRYGRVYGKTLEQKDPE